MKTNFRWRVLMSELFDKLFIFEMANNHQGDLNHGIKIIREMGKVARKHQINAGVKFQYRHVDTFIHDDYKEREDVKHIPRFMSTRLTDDEFMSMADAVRDEGMITIVTPFDETSVDKCLDHGIQIIKIASCSADDWPLLEKIVGANRPVIASTAGLRIQHIDNLASFFSHNDIEYAFMHCVALYPTPPNNIQMGFMEKMINRYPQITVGYSGHEAPDNYDIVKLAVGKGAKILERHVGVPTDKIILNKYSMNPKETSKWIESALIAREICEFEEEKSITQDEFASLLSLKRGVYASKSIKKGVVINFEDVYFAMPCLEDQVTSGEFGKKRATFVATKNYSKGKPIYETRKQDVLSQVRRVIHDAKGMIYEAKIVLGDDYTIELSHHYGMEHFRNVGAFIINLINREYCKKLIVVLKGQEHPNHRHKRKEETFQLLYGDLEVNLNGNIHKMKPGDKLLVERGSWHTFKSKNGAIFEEISTTHIVGDSYYEDENIAKLDPIERKTILEAW